ncbi:hypothetical protein [Oenococcus oeni]
MFKKIKKIKESYRNLSSWILNQGLRLPQSNEGIEDRKIFESLNDQTDVNQRFSRLLNIFKNVIQRRLYMPILIFVIFLFFLPTLFPSLQLIANLLLWISISLIVIAFLFLYLYLADVWSFSHPDKVYDFKTRFRLKDESYERSLAVVTSGKWYEKIIYSSFLRGFIQWISSGSFQWIALIIIMLPNNFQNSFTQTISNLFFFAIIINIFSNPRIIQYRRNHNLPAYSYLPLSKYFSWISLSVDFLFVLWAAAQIADILHEFFG